MADGQMADSANRQSKQKTLKASAPSPSTLSHPEPVHPCASEQGVGLHLFPLQARHEQSARGWRHLKTTSSHQLKRLLIFSCLLIMFVGCLPFRCLPPASSVCLCSSCLSTGRHTAINERRGSCPSCNLHHSAVAAR